MNFIAAVDKNFGIGKDNKLLFDIKEDLQYFKQKTQGKVVVMGRKTLESLPNAAPLKNRINIVLTTKTNQIENVLIARNLSELFALLQNYDSDDVFVIGGGKVYDLLIPYCDTAFLTQVEQLTSADTFITAFHPSEWQLISSTQRLQICKEKEQEKSLSFAFNIYKRIPAQL